MKKPASLIGNKNKFLILGCGYSGSYFAKNIKKFGCTVLTSSRSISRDPNSFVFNSENGVVPDSKIFDGVTHILSCIPPDKNGKDPVLKSLKNKLITFLGVTFKPNTDDMREASSLYMIPKLLKKGAIINYFDPSGKKNEFKKFKRVKYCKNVSQACLRSDLILLHTEWNEFKTLNFKKLIKKSNFKVFDMRNLYSPKSMKKKGIIYFGVGR